MTSTSAQTIVTRELYRRLVKSFMDIIVLRELKNGNPLGGNDILALVYKRFHILLSSGTVYSLLYSMERDGLIEGLMASKKRVYRLTEKGKEKLEYALESYSSVVLFMKYVLGK